MLIDDDEYVGDSTLTITSSRKGASWRWWRRRWQHSHVISYKGANLDDDNIIALRAHRNGLPIDYDGDDASLSVRLYA